MIHQQNRNRMFERVQNNLFQEYFEKRIALADNRCWWPPHIEVRMVRIHQ